MLKGLRPIRYVSNRLVGLIPRRIGERIAGMFLPDSIVPLRYLAAAMLSILPGLGQLFLGRWKAALLFFCGWLWWGFVAVQMPVEWWGGFFFGMVVVWHAAAALEALGVREVEASMWRRVRCMALLLAITVVPYLTLRMHVGETWGFYRALFPVAAQGVAPLDILLVDRRRVVNPVAGDVLLVGSHRGRMWMRAKWLRLFARARWPGSGPLGRA
jgi:hypothetical protein